MAEDDEVKGTDPVVVEEEGPARRRGRRRQPKKDDAEAEEAEVVRSEEEKEGGKGDDGKAKASSDDKKEEDEAVKDEQEDKESPSMKEEGEKEEESPSKKKDKAEIAAEKAAEKERKTKEAKEAKERKEEEAKLAKEKKETEKAEAKEKKLAAYEERKANAELKKREKELAREKAKKARLHNPSAWQRISKARAATVVRIFAVLLLLTALGSIGICSYWVDSALKLDGAMREGMASYCIAQGLSKGCLALPEVIMLPFYGFLAWACCLSLIAAAGIHGVAKEATASLVLFNVGGFVLGCAAIAFSAVALTMTSQLQSQCGVLPPYCLVAANASSTSSAAECQCKPPGGIVGPVRERYETLWDAQGAKGPWKISFGCGSAKSARKGSDCLVEQYGQAAIIMSILMLVPILFEGVGAVFAQRLKEWIIEERGRDLFPTFRLSNSAKLCLIPVFLFIVIFGVVIVAIAPRGT